MLITYVLIIFLFGHVLVFKKLIFKWNVFGVFFVSTIIFSTIGILIFPFAKDYFLRVFHTFKLGLVTDEQIIKTQILAVGGLLLVLYSYVLGLSLFYRKVKSIDHFKIKTPIQSNLSRVNFDFSLVLIGLFLTIYLFVKQEVLITGIFDGLLGRQPDALLIARRGITSNYLYVIIVYNLLPFLTAVSLYIYMRKRILLNRIMFFSLFLFSFFLILLLFQKRPLIIFLMSLVLSAYVFRKYLLPKRVKVKKVRSKKASRRRYIVIGISLFSLLLLLYYSGTTYQFENLFQAVTTLSEVVLTRVFGRLSLPAFFYVHYFPEVGPHYGLTNIGMLSNVFFFEHFPDTKTLFNFYSKNPKNGSLAINSIFDFYGAFGYFGFVLGNLFLGAILCLIDVFLNKLEKNGINIIFIVFCFVFAYYLSQASLARAFMGYGFVFFALIWMFLQKGFRIKLK